MGRERVAELRGSLHHYGQDDGGVDLTAGQMLSGAREEAAVPGTAPIALYDGLGVARLCEENDVAVLRARLPIAQSRISIFSRRSARLDWVSAARVLCPERRGSRYPSWGVIPG